MSTVPMSAQSPLAPSSAWRPDKISVMLTLLLGFIGFVVVYPVLMIVLNSFDVGAFGQETHVGLDNWTKVFSDRHLRDAVINTVTLTAARQFVAFVVGVALAWLIARTNLPYAGWIEIAFWISLFLPALPVTMSWMLLLGGRSGLINAWLRDIGLDAIQFTIYSWWGIIWVHLMTGTLSVKVFLLAPAFRNKIGRAHV